MDNAAPQSTRGDMSPEMGPPRAPQRSRRRQTQEGDRVKHRRTRSGCYTCRQRRVKCDETRPTCERCQKGNRDCVYPGTTPSVSRAARADRKSMQSPESFDSSDSEDDADDRDSQSVDNDPINDSLRKESAGLAEVSSRDSASSADLSRISSASSGSASVIAGARMRPTRRPSSRVGEIASPETSRLPPLPQNLQYYLAWFDENITHYHYHFKCDRSSFFKTTLISLARGSANPALMYGITAFAAYHQTVAQQDGRISNFLTHYNKSIMFLQQLLSQQQQQQQQQTLQHSIVTLLTILQLASIEEYLGDWVNLLRHRRAARQIIVTIYTPETVMQTEIGRKAIAWYLRFDIASSLLSGSEVALERAWCMAEMEYYTSRARDNTEDLGARLEEYLCTIRLFGADMAYIFASKAKNAMSDEEFVLETTGLNSRFENFGEVLETAFTHPSCFVESFPNAPPPSADEIIDFRDPRFVYKGDLFPMNSALFDFWATLLTFQHQVHLISNRPLPPQLTQIALRLAKLFEAVEHHHELLPGTILTLQGLGMICFFVPRDQKHQMWCRRKLALVEQLGNIFPLTFRKHLSELWGEDVMRWWLPNDHGCHPSILAIRNFIDYRETVPSDPESFEISQINGIFHSLRVSE